MTEKLVDQIGQFLPLKEQDLQTFLLKFKTISLKKGDYFIREGQVSRQVGFIIKACMLCSYNKDGNDVIDEFSLDKEFITDYHSFLTNTPADKDIKCIEYTELMIMDYDDLQKLYDENPVFDRVDRIMAEALFINWQQKK